MDVRSEGVRVLGRVSEQEKWNGLAGALAAVVPSPRESLSLLALEAFAVGTPVLGNAASPVVRGHVERSRAGATFEDPATFVEAVARVRAGARRHGACGAALRDPVPVGAGGGRLSRGDGCDGEGAMKLLGRDIDARALLQAARERLEARGIREDVAGGGGRARAGPGAALVPGPRPGGGRGPHAAAGGGRARDAGVGGRAGRSGFSGSR